MTKEEARKYLIDISYALGNMSIEYLTEKDGDKMREAIETLCQEPYEDVISRQAVLDALDKSKYSNEFCKEHHIDQSINLGMAHVVVNELKPVMPQPKTGHWISVNTGKQIHLKDGRAVESVKCSECDEWLIASDEYDCNGNYCPNCGAKMIEPQKESEEADAV